MTRIKIHAKREVRLGYIFTFSNILLEIFERVSWKYSIISPPGKKITRIKINASDR